MLKFFALFVALLGLLSSTTWAARSRSRNSGDTNGRLEKLETEVETLTNQILDLEEKVGMMAIERWCEKTIGCFFDLKTGTLTFADTPPLPVLYTGVPNELRTKVVHLNIIGIPLDTDFLVANLDGLEYLETLTLSNIEWTGEFTTRRAYLPNLKKFSITSSQFTPDNEYLEGDNLKTILFFDKTNDTSSSWKLDEAHRLGVDINVHGQFILERASGTVTSYKRPIETLLKNMKPSDGFMLKYLYLSSYNLTGAVKLPATLEYLGMNSVTILGGRDLNMIVKQLPNLKVLDVSIINVPTNPSFKLDLSVFPDSIKTLKCGVVTLTQSNAGKKLTGLETIRWFNTEYDDAVLGNFQTTFEKLVNAFILSKEKETQHKLLKALIRENSNTKNIMMPEFKFGEAGESTELDSFFSDTGITASENIIAATKVKGKWEKGSKFNFWKD